MIEQVRAHDRPRRVVGERAFRRRRARLRLRPMSEIHLRPGDLVHGERASSAGPRRLGVRGFGERLLSTRQVNKGEVHRGGRVALPHQTLVKRGALGSIATRPLDVVVRLLVVALARGEMVPVPVRLLERGVRFRGRTSLVSESRPQFAPRHGEVAVDRHRLAELRDGVRPIGEHIVVPRAFTVFPQGIERRRRDLRQRRRFLHALERFAGLSAQLAGQPVGGVDQSLGPVARFAR